jgi:eukaryotic-like serine/threonine-protein kinase
LVMAEFGRYQLLRPLGRGGMAEVFLARLGPDSHGKLLAIKRLLAPYSREPEIVERLATEAKLTVWLSHPNIVQVFDFGKIDESYYIAMEYIDGCDLRSIIRPPGRPGTPLPLNISLEVGYRVLDALRYAHGCTDGSGRSLGIIHRDVSPHNVLVTRDGHPKLADFGLARAMGFSNQITQPGTVMGKYGYMAPEQARGLPCDHRVDLYAAGALIYELLTGQKAFPERVGLREIAMERPPAPPSSIRPAIARSLDELLVRSMAPRPEDRFSTAAEMADAVLAELPAAGGPPEPDLLKRVVADTLSRLESRAEPTRKVALAEFEPDPSSLIQKEVIAAKQVRAPRAGTPVAPAPPPPAAAPQVIAKASVSIFGMANAPVTTREAPSWDLTDGPATLPVSIGLPARTEELVPHPLSEWATAPIAVREKLEAELRAAPPPGVLPLRPPVPASAPAPVAPAPATEPSELPPTARTAVSADASIPAAPSRGRSLLLLVGLAAGGLLFAGGIAIGRWSVPSTEPPPPRKAVGERPRGETRPAESAPSPVASTARPTPRPAPPPLAPTPAPTVAPAPPAPAAAPAPTVAPARVPAFTVEASSTAKPVAVESRAAAGESVAPASKARPAAEPKAGKSRAISTAEWNEVVVRLRSAQDAYLKGSFELAIAYSKSVIAKIPESGTAWQIIAASYCSLKRGAEAQKAYRSVAENRRAMLRKVCNANGITLPGS